MNLEQRMVFLYIEGGEEEEEETKSLHSEETKETTAPINTSVKRVLFPDEKRIQKIESTPQIRQEATSRIPSKSCKIRPITWAPKKKSSEVDEEFLRFQRKFKNTYNEKAHDMLCLKRKRSTDAEDDNDLRSKRQRTAMSSSSLFISPSK